VDLSEAAMAVASSSSPPVPIGQCWISGFFGEPRSYRGGTHMGMDMACAVGTDVFAIADGRVAFAGIHSNTSSGRNAGIQVQLLHGDGAIGRLGGSRYFHLDSVSVNKGDMVKAGQKIGTVGLTGVKSSGAHLHFESYTWGAKNNLLVCPVPGAWFPTIPFLPNAGTRYKGPNTPGAARVAKRLGG
jgi:murein DD-endopeptidase MepM/ murein hydrolase activator NlpD